MNYSVREVFDHIAALLGSDLQPRYEADLPGEAAETLADITLARSLGWEPKVDLATGLKRSIAYIREHVINRTPALSDAR